jgi:mannose-6-phosphate isomerase-like protein (cupin superfamily)
VKSFPQLVAFGMRHLRRLRVELMLETRVTGATATDVYLSNGESVPTRTIVSTVGMRANPLAERLEVERDDFGRILTEADLSVPGCEGLWAVGDCAAVPHPDGGTCPPVALYAGHQGTRVGRNVVRSVQGRRPKPYRKAVRMQGVSIGGRAAVGEIRGVGLKGRLPWLMWRFVLRRVIPTRDRRVRVAVDWLLTPFLGRDIVQLGPSERDDYDVRHTVFQPGEPLAARDRPLRFVHILVEGEAEVVRAGEPVALLGPGDHCGRKWLELHDADAVRARTLVRTVTLRSDEANRLQDVLLSTERLVADTRSHTVLDRSKLEAG